MLNGVVEEIKSNPWWLDAIYKVGVPAGLAIYLTYMLTTTFTDSLEDLQNSQVTLYNNQIALTEQLKLHSVDNSYILKETTQMKRVLQQICSNSAATRDERNNCFVNSN